MTEQLAIAELIGFCSDAQDKPVQGSTVAIGNMTVGDTIAKLASSYERNVACESVSYRDNVNNCKRYKEIIPISVEVSVRLLESIFEFLFTQ
ncbi:hypothetical protein [Numidum massiliense]|uniref:hypothetical protein n=1 Tax=Numidum massiliense TaxID=1522315 RepID=UPI0006D5B659|nr:hypothetical protein [Numidum massiliense]